MIEQGFKACLHALRLDNASEEDMQRLRAVFYCGARSTLDTIVAIADNDDDILAKIHDSLRQFETTIT